MAKVPKVVEERHAELNQLASKTEALLHGASALLWITWAITSGQRVFALTQVPALLGSQMQLLVRLWVESTSSSCLGLEKVPTPQERRLLLQLNQMNGMR